MKAKQEATESADYDGVWKDAIEEYFNAFMEFFFSDGHALIDWRRGVEFLDTELKRAIPKAVSGRGHVDKLVKVYLKTGAEIWIVIHIEVQTQKDGKFELRMYVYNYRIFDRYHRPVVSLAILADEDPTWRPNAYGYNLMGCEAGLKFPIAKLCDFRARMAELETSANPFAVIVLAHLKTQETHRDPESRYNAKLAMAKGFRKRGMSRDRVVSLMGLIDGMMKLPDTLSQKFDDEVKELEKEEDMPYVTRWERQGYARGALETSRKNLTIVLRERFDEVPESAEKALNEIDDLDRLTKLMRAALRAPSLEVFLKKLIGRAQPA